MEGARRKLGVVEAVGGESALHALYGWSVARSDSGSRRGRARAQTSGTSEEDEEGSGAR